MCTDDCALEVLRWAQSTPQVSLDSETYGANKGDGLLYTKSTIRLVQLCHDDTLWVLDCDHVSDELVTQVLQEFQGKPVYCHNSLFDIPWLHRRFGVLLTNLRDVLLASRTARAGEWSWRKREPAKKLHGLGFVLERELGVRVPKDGSLRWGGPLTEEHLRYAADDVKYLQRIYEKLLTRIKDQGVEGPYNAIVKSLPLFINASVEGVPLDEDRLMQIQETREKELIRAERTLEELAPLHPDGQA